MYKIRVKIEDICLLLAGFCFVIPALNLLLQNLVLLAGGEVLGILLPISAIVGFTILYFWFPFHFAVKEYLFAIMTFLVFALVFLVLTLYFYDTSRDGQAYHQEAVIQINQGWNPVKKDLSNEVMYSLFINHYPKASWINSASVYALTQKIETGKTFNYLYTLGTSLLVFSLLLYLKVSIWWAAVSALLLTLNTVTVVQLHTYMVDHINANAMTSLLACFIAWFLFPDRKKYWYTLIISILLIFDTKFTSIVNACLFLIFFNVGVLLFKRSLLSGAIAFSVCAMFLYLLTSFNPYLKNVFDSKHPLYPAMGENKIDVIGGQVPENYVDANRVYTFFNSLFSRSEDGTAKSNLKLPWQLTWKEFFGHAASTGTRKAGFGGTFALLFVSSLLLFIISSVKQLSKGSVISGFMTFSLLITVIINPVNWWARMVPQLWLVPVTWLIASMLFSPLNTLRLAAKGLLLLALLVQGSYLASYFYYETMRTQSINVQFNVLKKSDEKILVDFRGCPSGRKRWDEKGLTYRCTEINDPKAKVEKIIFSPGVYILKNEED